MKKVWIASIFATLMLLVPLTSVVGANEVEDCNCNPTVSDLQLVIIERLLDRLESRINFILLKYGHIPEVAEKCEEIIGIINSNDLLDIICDFIDILVEYFLAMYEILPYELWLLFFMIPSAFVLVFGVMFCLEYP